MHHQTSSPSNHRHMSNNLTSAQQYNFPRAHQQDYMLSAPHSQTKASGVRMEETVQQQLERKQKSMAIALK